MRIDQDEAADLEFTWPQLTYKPATYLDEFTHAAALRFGVTDDDVRSRSRSPDVCKARSLAMRLGHEWGYSTTEIAKYFGRDQSTVVVVLRNGRKETAGE